MMENAESRTERYAFVPDLFLPDLFAPKEFYPGEEQSVPLSDQRVVGQAAPELTDLSPWVGDQTTAADVACSVREFEVAPYGDYAQPSPPCAYPLQPAVDTLQYGGVVGDLVPSTSGGFLRALGTAASVAPTPVETSQSQLPTVASPLCCPVCCRTFRHKLGLTNHQRVHAARQPHTCSICGETFKYKTNFKRHRRVHAKEMRICRYCGENMGSDYDLVQHEKEHRRLQKL